MLPIHAPRSLRTAIGAATSILFTATLAAAAPLSPASYEMNNGHGEASSGSFNYWDLEYSGSGATNVDNAPLSGGVGNLTDGVITTSNFFDIENDMGTGPYVGWRTTVLPDISITFLFAGPVDIDTIRIHADDSGGAGGVNLPSDVTFTWGGGSATIPVVDPDASLAPSWLEFSQLGITSVSSVTVQLGYLNEWVFVDEVEFDGAEVPEAPTSALLALGLLGVGVARRRRQR